MSATIPCGTVGVLGDVLGAGVTAAPVVAFAELAFDELAEVAFAKEVLLLARSIRSLGSGSRLCGRHALDPNCSGNGSELTE